jgi:hypothetical protein
MFTGNGAALPFPLKMLGEAPWASRGRAITESNSAKSRFLIDPPTIE